MSDLISRATLLDAMPKNDELLSLDVRRVICDAPAVDAEPVRHGRWECKEEWFDNGFTYITMVFHKCSECGFKTNWRDKLDDRHKTLYNYCPRCGAKMDGGAQE